MEKENTLERTLDFIKKIEEINLQAATVAEIQEIVRVLLTGFASNAIKLSQAQYIHRTRICKKPDNIREVTYPPENKAVLGRANDKGVQRFYGSIGRSVPFFELNPQVGDNIVLSTWKTTDDILLNSVGYTEGSSVLLNSKRQLEKLYTSPEHVDQLNEAQKAVQDFLARCFVKKIDSTDFNRYKITAAISNILLAGETFDGLIYPTVRMFGNADNVVLERRFVDKSLKLVSVEYIAVVENAGINFKIEIIDTATIWDDEGNIEWSGRELGWNYPKMTKVTMKGENGEWVNLDEADRRIDPVPTNLIWKNLSPIGMKFKNCYPECFKASADTSLQGPDGVFTIRFAVVYDFAKKDKFLVFYIPICRYPFDAAKVLANAYDHFMGLVNKDLQEIILTNKENPESISSKEFVNGNAMHFFSEGHLDCTELAAKIIAGYKLTIDSPPFPTTQINYLYKPRGKKN